eukprot:455276_1
MMADSCQLHVSIREKSLINGYIRDIEKNKIKKVIPYAINMMCIDYYHSVKLLYHFAQDLPSGFHVADLDLNTSYIYDITPLHHTDPTITHDAAISNPNIIWNAGMYKQKNCKIPYSIHEHIKTIMHDTFSSNCNEYNVVFKCGGSDTQFTASKSCSAFILSPIVPSSSKQIALRWELPSYPRSIECHNVVYSEKHGLLSVGGFSQTQERLFYRLRLDDEQWESMPSTTDKRTWTSCVCVDDDRLMAVGGYDVNVGAINTVELFDFSENEWKSGYIKSVRHKRYRNGICFDKEDERIYISGGKYAERSTEWYDFTKNKWFDDIPSFPCKMDHYPVLWKEQKHILYVASHSVNCMLWMDLRDRAKWNVVYRRAKQKDTTKMQSLADKFGIKFNPCHGNQNRLLL